MLVAAVDRVAIALGGDLRVPPREVRQVDGVGVAVTGDEVIGMDIFAHPALFKKQYKALLHSYVTDALTGGAPASMEEAAMKRYEERAFRKFGEEDGLENEKYEFQGLMVHFVDL